MNRYTAAILAILTSAITSAQTIKNSFGQPATTGDKTIKLVSDPSKLEPGYRYGMHVEYEFSFGQEINRKMSYMAQIDKLVIRKDKGFFNQYFSEKTGTWYPCTKLENLCDGIEMTGINIVGIWEYNGKEYRTGAITVANRRDDKSYTNKPVEITLPGGSVIPQDAVKSGAARLVNIEVVRWSVSNTDPIMNIIQKLYSQKTP